MYIGIVILLSFLVISGRYLLFSSSASNTFSKINVLLIKNANVSYSKNKNSKINKADKYFILKYSEDGKWMLVDDEGIEAIDHTVENIDGRISITKIHDSMTKEFDVHVNGVRDYFNRSDSIVTDIPYDKTGDEYLVPEQEDLFPIFGYHNVFDEEEDMEDPYLDIRKEDFKDQINFYNEELNCRWLTFGNIVDDYILKKKKLPRNTCAMNFDDGRKNNYEIVFPLLKENNIHATFNIIFGHLGKKAYMTNGEVAELFQSGNEIGSHTVSGGGLVKADWFKGGEFTRADLDMQVNGSKSISEEYSYNSKTFAYPLGEWNDEVVDVIKKSGYIAARDTEKDEGWRDHRALATSMTDNFLWHFNYYKPELRYNKEIKEEIGYNGWWQFEEGNSILDDENSNVQLEWGIKVTEQSYAVIHLKDEGDANENSFILEKKGQHIIDMFIASSNYDNKDFSALIDGNIYDIEKDQLQECISHNNDSYCHYLVKANLSDGEHKLMIINKSGQIKLDRFRIYRSVPVKNEYNVIIKK